MHTFKNSYKVPIIFQMKDYEEFPTCRQDGFIVKWVNDNFLIKMHILSLFI